MTASGREVIGVGRSAEILAWGEDRAMKLYREGSSRAWVAREARVSRLVQRAGLPAPAVFDGECEDRLHEIGSRLGILYERVDGPTMLRDLMARPWMLVTHAKTLAALHAQIHATSGEGLPILRERIEWAIDDAAEFLSEGERDRARTLLRVLPDARQVCHGDFHPDNVLLHVDGPVIVDWGPASAGVPAADVAWTILLFRYAGAPVGASLPLRMLVRLVRRISLRVYLRAYSRLTGVSMKEIESWLGLVGILRLTDRIPEEHETLLQFVRDRIERSR